MHPTSNRWMALAAIVVAVSACGRGYEAEGEPAPDEVTVTQDGAIDVVGLYDYVVPLDNGDAVGTMTVTRAGDGYSVALTSNIGDVGASNVRREGNALRMDISTPNGTGTLDVTWQTRDRATGSVFLGETLEMFLTRRP